MPTFQVEVRVMPRPSLLDPQGEAVLRALDALGFERVGTVRVGKAITLNVTAASAAEAEAEARSMCERLLANPVTEDFTLRVGEAGS
jgi:phosphoribosylformylglycinamidine synthase subunit PurS